MPDAPYSASSRQRGGMEPDRAAQYRFGFDIGGTFTDLVLCGSDGSVFSGKCLSDHDDIDRPIVEGLKGLLDSNNIASAQVSSVVAGATTAVTNLVIERKGAVTGLITTAGFRDIIEIGRELRYDIYDLSAAFPEPIVPRHLRSEITERIDAKGQVLLEPTDADIEKAVLYLREQGAAAIAVCLLHSFRNPAHEKRIRDVAQKVAPELSISLSSDVLAEIREYERTVATALNAYVMPGVSSYLGAIEAGLTTIGIDAKLQIMQSGGGIISSELGERLPIRMLESGPAAGALGAADAARRVGCKDVLAFDMGGTTAKACLISDGVPELTTEFEAARVHRFKKGSGMPVRLPTVDLIEIGAGGGSIAYVDRTGLLKVGPRSAGSSPGPACYGLGGTEPTVTDAALVLGYLDPRGILSGQVKLLLDRAEEAIRIHVADPLGISVVSAASGIHRIVCEHMASAAKIHSVEKGRDLRRYTLLAFGGAGPIHAREVARRSGCKEILVPPNAGVFSAVGLLVAPLKVDIVRTRFSRLSDIKWNEIEELYLDMATRLESELVSAGVAREQIKFKRTADLRYVGQGFEVNTTVPDLLHDCSDEVTARFNAAYAEQFGQHLESQPVEALNWRLEAFADPDWGEMANPESGKKMRPRPAQSRKVFFPDIDNFAETPILRHEDLTVDVLMEGPALIEQPGSTVVIGPRDRFTVDRHGNIRVSLVSR